MSSAKPDSDPLTDGIDGLEKLVSRLKSLENQITHFGTGRFDNDTLRHMRYIAFQRIRPERIEVERIVLLLRRPQQERQATLAKLRKLKPDGAGNPVQ